MRISSTSDFQENENRKSDMNEMVVHRAVPRDLPGDPEYLMLLDQYQTANFARCKELLEDLEKRYYGHPQLLQLSNDLEIRLALQTISGIQQDKQKRQKKKSTLRLSVFALIGTIIATVAFILSFNYFYNIIANNQLAKENAQIASLSNQVEQLLLVGRPQPAAEILEKIRAINPDYENLPDLTTRTEKLLLLEEDYQTALGLISENRHNEALVLLRGIESEVFGLWDVRQQIEAIENIQQ